MSRSRARASASTRAARRARQVRRRAWWHRAWGTVAALLGAAALVAAAASAALVPGLLDDVRAFENARPCPTTTPAPADCLRRFPATVRGTVIHDGGRNQQYSLLLRGGGAVPAELDMYGADPLLSGLREGDRVTLTVWRDYTVAVTRDGVTQESADTPVGEPEFTTALACAMTAAGVYGAYAGTVAVRHARRHARQGLPAELVPLGAQAFWAGLAALPALFVGDFTGPAGVVVTWLLLLPLIRLAALRLHWGRGSRRRRRV
ncbi:hypothetical protein VM636_29310 [Streptomyces sp. SCSIO 75703]|uniref:hypothetical protein n=1 Tax=unclassified Streptomyces TaxID=2593676 RepID=UPI00068CAF83|nr:MULTISPECIES: hypothetical protein [unclassified Streptomyces]